MYPENDDNFEDKAIESVSVHDGKYSINCDGWTLYCGDDCTIKPEAGQVARMYPKGIGRSIRGLFIDGQKIWYRTEEEEKEHSEIQLYGADAKDWLARWDRGDTCWSIEMGGLGPGYEQCIHITAAECLRWFIDNNCDAAAWQKVDSIEWKVDREALQNAMFKNEAVKELGLSGAQYGAAVSIASSLYISGPRAIMNDEAAKDRKIQVQKFFPGRKAA